ncbi:MAG: VanZ family protein [Oscillospiraceae bacterium]|jgi:glycopeptide antibiotics resistance protein|nr:VanZ family protein [Oscillospiraceae bacterium]
MSQYYLGKLLELLPVILLSGGVCLFLRWRTGEALFSGRGIPVLLFTCYMTGLIALTAFPSNFWTHLWYTMRQRQPSGIEFRWFTFQYWLIPDFWQNFGLENLGNLLLYLPFGFLLPLVWARGRGWRTPAAGFALSLCVETLQLFIDRSFDINDLILNTVGGAAGWLLFLLFQWALSSLGRKPGGNFRISS